MAETSRSREHFIWLAVGTAGLLALALGALFLTPAPEGHGTHEQLGLPPCLSMALFGVPCPGCGVTTSVVLGSQGRFADSFANQPFGFLVFCGVLAFGLWVLLAQLLGRDLHADVRRLNRSSVWIPVAATLVVAWVYKLFVV